MYDYVEFGETSDFNLNFKSKRETFHSMIAGCTGTSMKRWALIKVKVRRHEPLRSKFQIVNETTF